MYSCAKETWCRTYHSVYCSHCIKCSSSFASLLGSSPASNYSLSIHILVQWFLFVSFDQLSYPEQEYPEWVLFTSSGISSALYHACDVGTWCVLTYNVLQVQVVVICIIIIIFWFFCVKWYLVFICFSSWISGSLSWLWLVRLCTYPQLMNQSRGQYTQLLPFSQLY